MIHLVWALLDIRKKAAAFLAKGESHLDTLDPNELPLLVSTAMKLEVCSKCAKGSVKKGLRIGGQTAMMLSIQGLVLYVDIASLYTRERGL